MNVAERTLAMKENFMVMYREGLSLTEIANAYNLSTATVYRKLQEIADENHVTRETLLSILHTPEELYYREEEIRVKKNMEELRKGFEKLEESINDLMNKMHTLITE